MDNLKAVMQKIVYDIKRIWHKYSKVINITKWSKAWWDHKCHTDLEVYRQSQRIEDWKKLKNTVKRTKHKFFDGKINEITNKKCRPWELMNWIKKRKLPAIEVIHFNSQPCIGLDDLWNALHRLFNSTQSWQVNTSLLDEISAKAKWP